MKTPYFALALVVLAVPFAPASFPCQAGTVTYEFVEGSGAPNPGEIGATITFLSPPASPTSFWGASILADYLGVQINDPDLFPSGTTGVIVPVLIQQPVYSETGATLTGGALQFPGGLQIFFPASSGFSPQSLFISHPLEHNVSGTWNVLASVPEPASAVQAGIAVVIGLALAAFRKRKEARRQRPVGPLDANHKRSTRRPKARSAGSATRSPRPLLAQRFQH
jgi:hypothetical protein